MKFCENLKNLRKSKKISQEELAEKIGVSRQSVSKWECGDAYPEMDNILKLCDIFNCKITDLVNENLVDINSLGEEVKMNIVKFKMEQQKKMKGLSKAIYILSRIGKIATIIGIISIILTMIVTPIISSNIKVEDNNTLKIFGEKIEYEKKNNEIIITYNNKDTIINNYNDVYALNIAIDKLENNSILTITIFIEVAFTFLVATLILLYITLKHLEQLFINIHNGDTPFTIENVNHINKMAILMILIIIIPNIGGFISQILINENLGIEFELFDFIYILFLFSMSYIFKYGYEIQCDSKGKMYGDINE